MASVKLPMRMWYGLEAVESGSVGISGQGRRKAGGW